jgi:glycosyltransferase involved in cell wall biosynthesis
MDESKRPLVSVVIPMFNAEETIAHTLQSVLEQSYRPLEVICVDDRSTDKTIEVVRQFKDNYLPELGLLVNEQNWGAPFSRNRGLKMAKGEFIQFLDADDHLLSEKIAHQMELVGQVTESIDIVAGNYRNEQGKEEGVLQDAWKGLFMSKLGVTSANLWRRDAVVQYRWDETAKSSQEYNLMKRMMFDGCLVIIDTEIHTVKNRRASGQISKTDPLANWKRYFTLRIEIMEWLKQNKQDYYWANVDFFRQELFDILRIWASYNLNEAVEMFNKHLGPNFRPRVSGATSQLYVRLFRIFGFRKTERIKRFIG